MGDRWEDNRTSSWRHDNRREGRRERSDNQFYRRSNRSLGDTWNGDSSIRNYNNDSYRKNTDSTNPLDGMSNGLVMYIDTNNIGRLIGRGGSKIKALEEESHAKINVNKIMS